MLKVLREQYPFLIVGTDYGTTELLSNMISDAKQDWNSYKETFSLPNDLTYETFKEEVINVIGQDLFEKLDSGEVDFCLICP